MAIDLVSLIKQFLTPDLVQKLARTLGVDATQAQTAVSGAVPALLAAVAGSAAQGGGAQLAEAVNQQASGLDSFAGMLGDSSQTSLVENGSKLVGSLLGTNTQTALSSALSTFSGLGQSATTALLGALAPLVLGVIGKQAGPQGFDAASLGNLLASQKDNIAAALPARLGGLLQGSGLLNQLGSTTTAAGAAPQPATPPFAAATARPATGTMPTRPNWLYWLVPLVLIIAGLWYVLGRPQPAVQQAANGASEAVSAAQNFIAGDIDLNKALNDNLGALSTSLSGITDPATATAALPTLIKIDGDIDKVKTAIGAISADQRAALAGLIAPVIATVTPLFDQVLAIPGVSDVLKPTIDDLRAKLASITS